MTKYYSVPDETNAVLINEAIHAFRKDSHPTNYTYNIEQAWDLWNELRNSSRFCCLTINSDYHYTYYLGLTQDEWNFTREFQLPYKHEPHFELDVAEVDLPILICIAYIWANKIEVPGVTMPWEEEIV